jgi:hypothetical protein
MNRASVLLACFVTLSCSNPTTGERSSGSERAVLVDAVPTGFGGTWVSKKYVDQLLATKSPKKSQSATEITIMVMPESTQNEAILIANFHEGISEFLVEKEGIFGFQREENGTLEGKFKLQKGRLKTDSDVFIKIDANPESNQYLVAEQLLFAGKYELDGREIVLTRDGKVVGIDSISHYAVFTDYFDAGMQVDQIQLWNSQDDGRSYGFQFEHDTLSIYLLECTVKEDGFCVVVQNGPRLFQLVKK